MAALAPSEHKMMNFSRCAIALAFIGVCTAINVRHAGTMLEPPAVTHLLKDPIGALGADSVGTVAQAMAGPEVDDAIAKQLDMLSNNPFAANAGAEDQDLTEVHGKIKSYLNKLNQLYAIADPAKAVDAPKNLGPTADNANVTIDDEEVEQEEEVPNLKLPQLRKAVLTAAIKKAASSALHAADSKMKEEMASEEARHTAAVQNLTSVAMKEKATTLTARWRVQQAIKAKKKADITMSRLQAHEMKTQMAINTLQEHDAGVKVDIAEAEKAKQLTRQKLQERIDQLRARKKIYEEAQDDLLEEKATQIQALFQQESSSDTGNKDAKTDSQSMERFLSVRSP